MTWTGGAPAWNAVIECLPEKEGLCIVAYQLRDGHLIHASYFGDGKWDLGSGKNITHWMPMPPPPGNFRYRKPTTALKTSKELQICKIREWLRINGPSSRHAIIKGVKIPRGTVNVLVVRTNFVLERNRWTHICPE